MSDPIQVAVDALFALCDGAEELTYELDGKPRPVEVTDGPLLQGSDEPRRIGVGAAAQYVLVAGVGQERRGYGGRTEHQIDISCQIEAWSGDTKMSAARAAAADTLQALRRLLGAHPDLDGAVGLARLVRHNYKPLQTDQGAAVQIEAVVRVNGTTFDDE